MYRILFTIYIPNKKYLLTKCINRFSGRNEVIKNNEVWKSSTA